VIGLIGMVLGWGLGYLMSKGLETIRISMDAIITAEHLFIVYDPFHYIAGGVSCMIAATFAAWLPARKAALLKPVDIIRGAAG
jgi:lipoprotein-releasing system permease protein